MEFPQVGALAQAVLIDVQGVMPCEGRNCLVPAGREMVPTCLLPYAILLT